LTAAAAAAAAAAAGRMPATQRSGSALVDCSFFTFSSPLFLFLRLFFLDFSSFVTSEKASTWTSERLPRGKDRPD
jgi:hypothetical protein